ncbi:hypothetical protein K458DRAFT_298376 [Lentithecium fluviatile CBS 122367]|uniref:Rhodopsin domain-containing protein n=1 Tax=Lentithecium fluviatile CBS 122367 TaxID=1168545 RepID=A0A6G1J6Y2_9PLEO|nr:hypothetical protein K458DRAFT_298376 [Lentithecium fluviatile CBS 122367]
MLIASRFYTRGFIVKKYGFDDLFIAVAVLLGAAQTATVVVQVKHGRGKHAQDIELRHYNHMLMFNWINVLVYFLANWTVKMSILALYRRIGSGQRGLPCVLRFKVIGSIAVVITMFTTAIFLVELFGCTPISRAWDVQNMQNGCMSKTEFNIVQASINVFIDLLLLFYPLPLLRILRINTQQRTALVVIFSIGIVPPIASMMRLCEIVMAVRPTGATWLEGDSSWNWAWVTVWSQIEVDVSIVAASLPSLSPLLKQLWSGFAMERPLTPSQISTLLGPESKRFPTITKPPALSVERSKGRKCSTFFDDAREEDRDREVILGSVSGIGVAITVDMKASSERPGFQRVDSAN